MAVRIDNHGAERFFQGVADQLPLSQLSHLFLLHWPQHLPTPLTLMNNGAGESGFRGFGVAGRVSLARVMAKELQSTASLEVVCAGTPDSRDGHRILLHDHPTAHQPATRILAELPQGREAQDRLIHNALTALSHSGEEGAELLLFGTKDGGIVSAAKRWKPSNTRLSRGHLRLLAIPANATVIARKPRKTRPHAPVTQEQDGFFHYGYRDLSIATLPGVFSWRSIDPASHLLLETLEGNSALDTGTLLDWGCGAGVIGATLARRHPALQVTLSDDLFSAVCCARRTLESNGLVPSDAASRCTVIAEDGLGPLFSGQRFDTIVTNPPFHRGTRSDYETARRFLSHSRDYLSLHGHLHLVGNRFLDYGPLMRAAGLARVKSLAENERYAVWTGKRHR
ncbi:MAG: methyltransferase [Magnetococcales bacterium]|nr:methyltransferase [Magnetococcales bacterium]